jgi:hypothetical protein
MNRTLGWTVRGGVVLAGAGAGVWAGLSAAPDVPAVAGGLAVSGGSAGVLVLLLAGWRRQGAAEPAEPEAPREPEGPEPPAAGDDAPPGWYPDPDGAGTQRFWDGSRWSDHVWRERPSGRRRAR